MNTLCSAQGKAKEQWGKIGPADFEPPHSALIDSNASAVIIADEGSTNYVGSKTGWFSYVFTRHTRIKILNKKAYSGDDNISRVELYLQGRNEHRDKLSRVDAVTYNLENGQVVQTRLADKDIFQTKLDKETTEAKFSLPGVKECSIIEYTYTITSDRWYHIPAWQFQWQEYPCLHSQFQVEIPQTLRFMFVRQGVHALSVDKGSAGNASFRIQRDDHSDYTGTKEEHFSISTVKHTWTMQDVPAFGEELYLTTPKNYLDAIEFQLVGTNDGETTDDFYNSWAKANEGLLRREDFGGALSTENDEVDALADKIGGDATTSLARAKSVYYYVSQHFTCTDHHDAYITTNLRDLLKSNNGTVGDINLLLIAMLRRKGFTADPVMLSTRDKGFNLVSYPVLSRLNYVVVRLTVDGRIYYLDAAHPQLGFGQLAGDCYNGHARVISKQDSCSIWFWADSLKENKMTMVLLASTDKGLEGSWQSTLGTQESFLVRRDVKQGGEEKYFKDIQTEYGSTIGITAGGIDSLDQPENPVKVHYNFSLNAVSGEPMIYLNPIIGDGWHNNPFKAADRKYPVEMPYTIDETYIFSMAVPNGYVVEETPKSTRVAYNGDQGSFEYLVQPSADQIQLRCRLKLNKATFLPEDYASLRDFFAYVVKKENEQIVLKKK